MVRLGFVVSEFNSEITGEMEKVALAYAKELGAEVVRTIHVPGAFDMPLAVDLLLKSWGIDAVVTLGCVMQGETRHDELIAHALASSLHRLSLKHSKPVALGVMGPGINEKQARARIKDYAKRAVDAAIKLHTRLVRWPG
ncbi:MAG: 6,7-dimethyl-8-ribityllumazine synthase [Candidatus Micrarchaeia archaeon]